MGRPTDNPKPHQMTIKFDDECKSIIDSYSEQEHVSKMETVRRGVKKLKEMCIRDSLEDDDLAGDIVGEGLVLVRNGKGI